MNDIQLFSNESFGEVRAFLNEGGEPSFVAKDVCNALGLSNVGQALASLDEDEKSSITIADGTPGNPNKATVTEPGFYKLVMRSRKPEAKAFQRWVTHEVLPALRRDGGYMVARDETPEQTMARAVLLAQRTIETQERKIAALEEKSRKLANKSQAFELWVEDVDGLVSVTKAGKLLRSLDPAMNSKRLRNLLRHGGYIEKRTLSCIVKAIEPGYMRERLVKFVGRDGKERVKSYGCLTAKGLSMCAERYCNQTTLA